MKLDDWLDAGYKRWETQGKQINKLADFGLQKLICDDAGRRYYITVYVYDRTRYPGYPWQEEDPEPYGFMPTAQFVVDKPFFNIEVNGDLGTVAEVEAWVEKFWEAAGKPYSSRDYPLDEA